jgi:hypothetical protein
LNAAGTKTPKKQGGRAKHVRSCGKNPSLLRPSPSSLKKRMKTAGRAKQPAMSERELRHVTSGCLAISSARSCNFCVPSSTELKNITTLVTRRLLIHTGYKIRSRVCPGHPFTVKPGFSLFFGNKAPVACAEQGNAEKTLPGRRAGFIVVRRIGWRNFFKPTKVQINMIIFFTFHFFKMPTR